MLEIILLSPIDYDFVSNRIVSLQMRNSSWFLGLTRFVYSRLDFEGDRLKKRNLSSSRMTNGEAGGWWAWAPHNKQLPFTPSNTWKIDGCLLIFYCRSFPSEPSSLIATSRWLCVTCKLVLTILWRHRWSVSKQQQMQIPSPPLSIAQSQRTRHTHTPLCQFYSSHICSSNISLLLLSFPSHWISATIQTAMSDTTAEKEDENLRSSCWLWWMV